MNKSNDLPALESEDMIMFHKYSLIFMCLSELVNVLFEHKSAKNLFIFYKMSGNYENLSLLVTTPTRARSVLIAL